MQTVYIVHVQPHHYLHIHVHCTCHKGVGGQRSCEARHAVYALARVS